MADEVDFVFVEEVWNGVEPFVEDFDLNIIDVVAASSEIDAFAYFIVLLGKGCKRKEKAEGDEEVFHLLNIRKGKAKRFFFFDVILKH